MVGGGGLGAGVGAAEKIGIDVGVDEGGDGQDDGEDGDDGRNGEGEVERVEVDDATAARSATGWPGTRKGATDGGYIHCDGKKHDAGLCVWGGGSSVS